MIIEINTSTYYNTWATEALKVGFAYNKLIVGEYFCT